MFIKNLLYFIIVFLSLNSYSNPTPLGLELNKATTSDLIKKYKITGEELNYWQGHNYFIEPNEKYISKSLS